VVIENNRITGLVSFYGRPDPRSEFNLDLLFRLITRARRDGEEFIPRVSDLNVHIHDNRLTRFVIGAEFAAELEHIAESGSGQIEMVLASLH